MAPVMSLNPDIKSVLRERGVDFLGLSHRDRRKLFKREKRRLRRQAAAKRRSSIREETSLLSESVRALDSSLRVLRETECRLQECSWRVREREFLTELGEKKRREESRTVVAQIDSRIREDTNHQVSTPVSLTHFPFSPPTDTYIDTHMGTGVSECEFFLKTGTCRFGGSCRNSHPCPSVSRTLVFPHLFSGAGVSSWMVDGREQDVELENDETEVYQRFLEFHEDVFPELSRCGEVERFEVCSNQEFHLRGNVFVKFRTSEEAQKCRDRLNGRWYDRRLVSCEFSGVQDFGQAICQVETAGRLSQSKKFKICLKGKNCNYWHVFRKTDY